MTANARSSQASSAQPRKTGRKAGPGKAAQAASAKRSLQVSRQRAASNDTAAQDAAQPPTAPGKRALVARSIGAALAVIGLGAAAIGLFAMPVQDGRLPRTPDVGFVQIRQLAAFADGSGGIRGASPWASGLARFWWSWGLLVAVAVLIVLVALAALRVAARTVGALITVIGLAALVLQVLSYSQTHDYVAFTIFATVRGSLYDTSGPAIWLSITGLSVVAVAGVVHAVIGRWPGRSATR